MPSCWVIISNMIGEIVMSQSNLEKQEAKLKAKEKIEKHLINKLERKETLKLNIIILTKR